MTDWELTTMLIGLARLSRNKRVTEAMNSDELLREIKGVKDTIEMIMIERDQERRRI